MSDAPDDRNAMPGLPGGAKSIREHWLLFLIEGIVLLVLGGAAILVPGIATLAATFFFGWLLIIGGGVGLVTTLMGRHAPGLLWSLLSAVIAIAAGIILIGWPIPGMLSLTLVLAAFLMIDGVISIFYALEHRRHASQRWIWLLVNGVLDLVLAGLILWWLPHSAAWVLGLILGIDLVFGGTALIAMALAARRMPG
jgi:uncharacterized membrane protein HdeD (DUF308 family)